LISSFREENRKQEAFGRIAGESPEDRRDIPAIVILLSTPRTLSSCIESTLAPNARANLSTVQEAIERQQVFDLPKLKLDMT
jgi:hypothetical protein